jgi:hypothetical protein
MLRIVDYDFQLQIKNTGVKIQCLMLKLRYRLTQLHTKTI